MAASPIDTAGTALKRGNNVAGASDAWVAVAKVRSIDPIGSARTLRQITDLSHTDTHKHKLGLPDMPPIAVEVFYDPDDAQHAGIIADHNAGLNRDWQIELADSGGTVISFSALVIDPNLGAEVDGDYPLRFQLKPQTVLTYS